MPVPDTICGYHRTDKFVFCCWYPRGHDPGFYGGHLLIEGFVHGPTCRHVMFYFVTDEGYMDSYAYSTVEDDDTSIDRILEAVELWRESLNV